MFKKTFLFTLCLLSPATQACDTAHLALSGYETVPTCSPKLMPEHCVPGGKALYEYMEAVPDSEALYTIGLQASPWRMYDGDMRILTVDEVADAARTHLGGKVERVELLGSWTGVSPTPGVPSLAERVSNKLGGFPVKGEEGFLWLAKDGSRRVTRQAFTAREGAGSYSLPEGADVFVPLVAGWPAHLDEETLGDDPELLLRAAAGQDIFFLCPDQALAGYQRAAAKGSAIAAYNAALMRLERGADGDRKAALSLLEQATALGDAKSLARLERERASK